VELNDTFGRTHKSLRISVMDKCNLRCTYCMPENMQFLKRDALMTRDEIDQIASIFVNEFGIRKIRLTGGEPLLRDDIVDILSDISALGVEVGLTTNALKLDERLNELVQAGLRSVNISLDSLHAERFKLMARRDGLEKVLENIDRAHDAGLHVKVNMVVMKGINEDEILPFVDLTKARDLHIRFIEFMPFAGNRWTNAEVVGYKDILERVERAYSIHKLDDRPNSTAKAWQVDGFTGTFAVISTITEPFCSSCDRLRLTAEGKMRNCLFSQAETDLLSALRKGEDIRPLIQTNVLMKKERLGGLPPFEQEQAINEEMSERPMVSIGG
jgi:cyclic pyranopterin phosphate synthase